MWFWGNACQVFASLVIYLVTEKEGQQFDMNLRIYTGWGLKSTLFQPESFLNSPGKEHAKLFQQVQVLSVPPSSGERPVINIPYKIGLALALLCSRLDLCSFLWSHKKIKQFRQFQLQLVENNFKLWWSNQALVSGLSNSSVDINLENCSLPHTYTYVGRKEDFHHR